MEDRRPTRVDRLAALLPACLAIWLYWPVLDGGLLSDDLLLRAYAIDHDAGGGTVAWRHVLEDLRGPWLFGPPFYYRPFTTFTFVGEHWLFGGAAGALHATNLGLFVLSVHTLGRLAGLLAGPLAALAAGTLLAVHPVANETICWPCARADLLIVATTLWACLALVRHRRAPGRFALPSLSIACGLALLSKESALAIPPLLVALDLALGGGDWRRRSMLHVALLPLWGVYLWWRAHIGVTPALADLPPDLDWSRWPGLQLQRFAALVAPNGSKLPVTLAWLLGGTLAAIWLTGVWLSPRRRWLAFGAAWAAIASAPTTWQMVFPDLINSRFMLLAWAGMALATAVVLGGWRKPRWWTAGLWLLLALAAIDMGRAGRLLQGSYAAQWQRLRSLQEQLAAVGATASAEAPVVFLSAHIGHDTDVPFLDAERAYALAIPPATAAPLPFVSLGSVLDPAAGPELMQGDVAAWRMMWQHGAKLVYWVGQGTGGQLVTIDGKGTTPVFRAGPRGFTAVGGPASPWSIAAVEVRAATAFAGGRLTWHAASGHAGGLPIGSSERLGDLHVATVDLASDAAFVLFGTLHGIERFEVDLQGASATPTGPTAAPELVARPLPAPGSLRTRLRGAPVALEALGTRLPWDSLPADADPGSAKVVLMNRSFAWQLARPGAAPLELPRPVRLRLWQSDRIGGEDRLHYYLECRVGGRPWRSQVDWFVTARR